MSAITTPLPKVVRILVGVLCAAVALSALGLIAVGVFAAYATPWILIGFESVVVLSAALGLVFCFNRFQEAQGLAIVCTAGTVAFAAFCTWLSLANHELIIDPDKPGVSYTPVAAARIATGGLLALIAAYAVLRRNPGRSASYIVRASLALAPVVVFLVWSGLFPGSARSAAAAMPGWLLATAAFVGSIVGLTLISVGLHCIIRAFEAGRLEASDDNGRSAAGTVGPAIAGKAAS